MVSTLKGQPDMPTRGRTLQEKVTSAQRQQKAVELVEQGFTLDQVAQQLGYADRSGAWQAVQAVLSRADYAAADGLRNVMGAQLAADLRRLHDMWTDLDRSDGMRLQAYDRVLRTRERISKLFGLDAPVKVDATVRSEVDAEIAALAGQLGIGASGAVPVE